MGEEHDYMSSPVKALPMIQRKTGEAGEKEDRVISEFMKLVDLMEDQRCSKMTDQVFRDNYRKRSMQNGAKSQFSQQNFIQPTVSPSKTNILQSSNTFRSLTAQKLSRHTSSTLNMRKSGLTNKGSMVNLGGVNPSVLRASSELANKKSFLQNKLPAVRGNSKTLIHD